MNKNLNPIEEYSIVSEEPAKILAYVKNSPNGKYINHVELNFLDNGDKGNFYSLANGDPLIPAKIGKSISLQNREQINKFVFKGKLIITLYLELN